MLVTEPITDVFELPQVPQDWLKTDFDKGLSDGDIEGRRKDFGYNELTR